MYAHSNFVLIRKQIGKIVLTPFLFIEIISDKVDALLMGGSDE